MNGLIELWTCLASELGKQCGVCVERDIETVRSRVEHEGLSFLTITLPTFSTGLERSLDIGCVDLPLFSSFKRRGQAPAFLRGFLNLVFDCDTGALRNDADAFAVYALRQLTLIFKKMELSCTPEREHSARHRFIQCEEELKVLDSEGIKPLDQLHHTFSRLYSKVMLQVAHSVDHFELVPKHGPGATSDRLKGNRKFYQTEWTERLENVFPFGEYVLSSWRYWQVAQPEFFSPAQERPVKVVLVPKTLKTPRVIAVEPTCMQYMQQGVASALVPSLEADNIVGPMIGFTDQIPNRDMAREGSITGKLATLDLKEASDRVLNSVVLKCTSGVPSFSEALQACRTRTAKVEGFGSVRLAKFASMGSALCFPVEAMVFLAIVIYGIEKQLGRRLSVGGLMSLHGKVRVYGDDIIVPVEFADSVSAALATFGLQVNTAKSFSHGNFRESCGGDYWGGEDVSPVRLRHLKPQSRADAAACANWCSFMNLAYKRGLWKTAEHVRNVLEERHLLGPLPVVPWHSNALGLHSFTFDGEGRWSQKRHVPVVKAWVLEARQEEIPLDGFFALRKCFAGDWSDPAYRDHLLLSGRPRSVKLKKREVEVGEFAPTSFNGIGTPLK